MPHALAIHGGPDAQGVPLHDFSTNANACGPCPVALAALRQADRGRYPDPAYTELRARLAAFHGVEAGRIVASSDRGRIGSTHALTPPEAEDWGWYSMIDWHGRQYLLGSSASDEEDGQRGLGPADSVQEGILEILFFIP